MFISPVEGSISLCRAARWIGAAFVVALVGACQPTDDFGGSGGSFGGSGGSGGFGGSGGSFDNSAGQQFARDACVNEARARGLQSIVVTRTAPYVMGGQERGADVFLQVRRSQASVNVETRRCRFTYSNGAIDFSLT